MFLLQVLLDASEPPEQRCVMLENKGGHNPLVFPFPWSQGNEIQIGLKVMGTWNQC